MAPEVLMQKPYDGRADLFSLGLVYYEMLGGAQPFETDSIAGTLASVLHTEQRPIEEVNPKVPGPISSVVQTMLAKDPAQRYSTARDVLIDLRRVQEGERPVFAQTSKVTKKRFDWKMPAMVGAGVVALVIGGFLLRNAIKNSSGVPISSSPAGEKSATLVVLPLDSAAGDAKLVLAAGEVLLRAAEAAAAIVLDRAVRAADEGPRAAIGQFNVLAVDQK